MNGTIFGGKKFSEHKMYVLIFSTNFVWNISNSKKNSTSYCHKCTSVFIWSTFYSCQILIQLEISQQVSKKMFTLEFHENLTAGFQKLFTLEFHENLTTGFQKMFTLEFHENLTTGFQKLFTLEFHENLTTGFQKMFTLEYHENLPGDWEPSCSIRTDRHKETNNRFS